VQELIDLFQLNGLLDLYPPSLSGGQRQRVAIAQSLVQKPRVLLLDEPMSALDEETRKQIQEVILAVHKRLKMTVFMVSHDLNETLTMSDYVLLIKNGTVLKSGTPLAVFSNGLNTKLEGKIIDLAFLHDRVVLKVIVGDNIVSIERPFANKEEYMIGQSLTLEIA
jgi:molybdate transport system ATP-binding protein